MTIFGNDIRVGVINIKNDDIKMSYKNNTSKVDLLLIPPIKVLKGDELNKYEGKTFYQYLIDNVSSIQKNEKIAKNLYFHYLRNNEVLKSSVLAIDKIMSDGVIIQTWKPGHNKKQKNVNDCFSYNNCETMV